MRLMITIFFLIASWTVQAQTLTLNVPSMSAQPGDVIDIPILVTDFNAMTGIQFSLGYNPNVLQYNSGIINIPMFLGNITPIGTNSLAISWSTDNGLLGTTLPNGATFFTLNFTVVGALGTQSPLTIQNIPVSIELTDLAGQNAGNVGNVNVNINNGNVVVGGVQGIPTMSEWGLIILCLLMLTVGLVYVLEEKVVIAGGNGSLQRTSQQFPFEQKAFIKGLKKGGILLLGIGFLYWGLGTEFTTVDLIGFLIIFPIISYMIHLFLYSKSEF